MTMTEYLAGILLFPSAHIVEHSPDFHPSGFSLLLTIYERPSLMTMSGNKGLFEGVVAKKRKLTEHELF